MLNDNDIEVRIRWIEQPEQNGKMPQWVRWMLRLFVLGSAGLIFHATGYDWLLTGSLTMMFFAVVEILGQL